MATQAYYDWIKAGRPYTLARPVRALRDRLRAYGYTVYDYPNTDHQQAEPPEDHTPYSATGWPVASPRWYGMALDVMPSSRTDLPDWRDVADQMFRDKQAGLAEIAWLKYMNRELPGTRTCVQDRWQPTHVRRSSNDTGHIHGSCRSDFHLSAVGDSYDPVARYRARIAGVQPATEEDDMIGFAKDPATGQLRKSAGGITYPTTQREIDDIRSLAAQGVIGPVSSKVHPNLAYVYAFGYPVELLVNDIAKRVIELLPPGGAGVTEAQVREIISHTSLTPPAVG